MSDRRCGNCLHNIRGTQYIPPCSQCWDYSLWAEHPEPSEFEQLQAELATTKAENRSLCGQLAKEMEARTPTLEALNTAKAENEDLCDNIDAARQERADYLAGTLEGKLKAENKRLKEFARPVIRQECWSIFEQDGGDIQELAEKLGLIEPRIATKEDVDDESDHEVGDKIFVFSETLKENSPCPNQE